ncbi:TPA: helix-turn-helix domain-containing protein [Burkholderia orbicola]|uniref:helix-turn-helix domain-containing protein n=1 Tax=Burkholderia orbicola TaxID=2978683 RepID=UPI00265374D9|nr:helix-turn-helix domain-containing protein [Burkholderia orbicola]MDN7535514.1 helix-turn-helix domain-containing protein [Burkholderia orbicola]
MSDSAAKNHSFQSNDPDEVSSFIGKIYADNRFEAQHAKKQNVTMAGHEWRGIGIYDVDYRMPFHFSSEESRPTYLFLSCGRGHASYLKGNKSVECGPGDVLPISSEGVSDCTTGTHGFGHLSVIIEEHRINSFLQNWLGQPLIEPVRFDLQPLAKEAAGQWDLATTCLNQMLHMDPVPHFAADALVDHIIKLFVSEHHNNYSSLLDNDRYTPEDQTCIAINLIVSDPMRWKNLGSVAYALGCPTSALDRGIRRVAGKSSADIFYEARLDRLRDELARGASDGFQKTLQKFGFSISDRFVRQYHYRFGELPSATYRRNPHVHESVALATNISDFICEKEINRFIDEHLSGPISLEGLSNLIGMPEYALISAFKSRFSKTPMQYVIERRLEHAITKLKQTSTSILSIAIECGFGTQSYLTTTMRRHYGTTPGKIRENAKRPVQKDPRGAVNFAGDLLTSSI